MSRLDNLVIGWWRDNAKLHGAEREARHRELYDALAAVGGEHATATLLAICDDVLPYVAVFDTAGPGRRNDPTWLLAVGNPPRVASLRALNARRFGAGRAAG